MKNKNMRALAECAILIAVGTILAQIKIYRLPQGGSVTAFSMVPFIIASYRHGTRWGLFTGLANAIFQILLGGIYPPPAGTASALIASIMLDYVLAYVFLGFADCFATPFKASHPAFAYAFGAGIVCFLRFLCAFLSGWLIWGDVGMTTIEAVSYSIGYNGAYLLPETVVTIIGILALQKYYPKALERQYS